MAKLSDPATIHAVCEEYRAAATLDVEHDDADRGVRRISCPTLVLWSATGAVDAWYEPLELWRDWAEVVSGGPMDCGHYLPEEAPAETAAALIDFLTGTTGGAQR